MPAARLGCLSRLAGSLRRTKVKPTFRNPHKPIKGTIKQSKRQTLVASADLLALRAASSAAATWLQAKEGGKQGRRRVGSK